MLLLLCPVLSLLLLSFQPIASCAELLLFFDCLLELRREGLLGSEESLLPFAVGDKESSGAESKIPGSV